MSPLEKSSEANSSSEASEESSEDYVVQEAESDSSEDDYDDDDNIPLAKLAIPLMVHRYHCHSPNTVANVIKFLMKRGKRLLLGY